jgi:hypothetical protein
VRFSRETLRCVRFLSAYGCDPLLIDIDHFAGSQINNPKRRNYVAKFGAAVMPAELPTESRSEFVCDISIGDPTKEAFEALPVAIRNLGPWTGSKEGEVGHLRLTLRSLLVDQDFVIVHAHVSKLNLENPIGTYGLHPANTECSDCKGTGQEDQHGGLRNKTCWRCAGRGWLRAPIK